MPKIIIPREGLPEMDIYTQKYNVRYRIVSENQNNISYWSPIFEIDPGFIFVQGSFINPGQLVMQKHTGYVANTWDSVGIYKTIDLVDTLLGEIDQYDFWIQYTENGGANPSDWMHKERISTTSMNEVVPATYTDAGGTSGRVPKWMRVEIYRPGRPVLRYNDINISITQNGTTVNTTSDTIITPTAHGLSTGDTLVYTASSAIGGLTTDTAYWANVVNTTTFGLYESRAEAIENINKINLSSTGSGTGTFDRYPFLLYKEKVTTL